MASKFGCEGKHDHRRACENGSSRESLIVSAAHDQPTIVDSACLLRTWAWEPYPLHRQALKQGPDEENRDESKNIDRRDPASHHDERVWTGGVREEGQVRG
jgi:hypothetical protein